MKLPCQDKPKGSCPQHSIREQVVFVVKNGVLQLTLRQMQADFSKPIVWLILIGVGVVLAIAGAFGTGAILRPFPLAIYWVGTVCLTYGVGSFISLLTQNMWRHWNKWLRIGISGLLIGIAAFVIIVGQNIAIFGQIYDTPADLIQFAVIVLAVTSVVNLILNLAFEAATQEPIAALEIGSPPILERIPFDQRGRLVAISVEDHYVRIRTDKGEAMILMRLSDAIKETTPEPGMHVHRSHWVATAAIRSVTRSGSGALLSVSHGSDIPVSRSKLPLLKDAGLL